MSGQPSRFFVAFTPWRWAVLLMASLFVAGCSDSGDGGSDDPAPQLPSEIRRISVDSSGVEANATNVRAKLSGTGRYVVYQSAADNLVVDDTNLVRDIFLHDVLTGKTSRVSVNSTGVQGDDESIQAMLSADGRYVVFRSTATNLVDNDANESVDIFLYDTQTGETQRVSVANDGAEADGGSSIPSISADGKLVVFNSRATNLVTGDTNNITDVFLRDLQSGTISRISVDSVGTEGNAISQGASISGNGQFVVFESSADNLVASDVNNINDLFIRDTVNNTTAIVSVHSDGTQSSKGSALSSIRTDGRFVAFSSSGSELVNGDTNQRGDVFLRDVEAGVTSRVSVNSTGEQGDGSSSIPSINGDGRYVAFVSSATNFVDNDTNGRRDIFVKDLQANVIARVSVSAAGIEANDHSDRPVISSDGRYIVFESDASNLVDNDTNEVTDTFITPNPLANE